MSWASNFINRTRAFWKGPVLQRGTVIRYAGALIRVSGVRFDKHTAQWRYHIEGSTGLDYSEAAVVEMKQDYISFMLKKSASGRQCK